MDYRIVTDLVGSLHVILDRGNVPLDTLDVVLRAFFVLHAVLFDPLPIISPCTQQEYTLEQFKGHATHREEAHIVMDDE